MAKVTMTVIEVAVLAVVAASDLELEMAVASRYRE